LVWGDSELTAPILCCVWLGPLLASSTWGKMHRAVQQARRSALVDQHGSDTTAAVTLVNPRVTSCQGSGSSSSGV
jgi:hypothetical protein